MPRPRVTEPEIPCFKEAIASFNGCTLEKAHKRLFSRIHQLIKREGIPIDEACEAIAQILKASREDVKAKLIACQPHTKPDYLDPPSRPEPWPSIRSFFRQDRD